MFSKFIHTVACISTSFLFNDWIIAHCIKYGRRQRQPTPVLLPGKSHGWRNLVGCSPWGREVGHDWVTSLSLFTFMHWRRKKEMATHSSIPAWRIPRTGEPGGLPSMESHRVGHDWSDLPAAAAGNCMFKRSYLADSSDESGINTLSRLILWLWVILVQGLLTQGYYNPTICSLPCH